MMYLPIESSLTGDEPSIGAGTAAVARWTTHFVVGRSRFSAPQGGVRSVPAVERLAISSLWMSLLMRTIRITVAPMLFADPASSSRPELLHV